MPEWLNIVIRSIGSLLFLFLLAKILGKRQLRQLTYIEYIVGISIGEIVGFIATDLEGSWQMGFLAMAIIAMFPVVLQWISMKSKSIRNVVEGNSTVLIKDGKVLEDNMKKERLCTDDLMEHLRMKNVFRVADVEFAVLESNGDVSVLLKSENQPLTAKHLGIVLSPEREPQTVIMDGEIMDEPLATIGLNRGWLRTELEKAGVTLENVFIGQVDKNGELFLDLYDDKLQVPQPQVPKATYATLKKCQADLELFALSTRSEEAKSRYSWEAKRLQQVIDDLVPLLTR
ncbi:DUF421 domain-containing protein [Brevibacillus sp. B_LB10_24]|uniref:DUF421 domain-containing protein n=1 Tax=Brevibacillus sp. B_LB10_24 TaxID=3380645 RepID=UPI0038B730EA